MKLNEIKGYAWKVAENLDVSHIRAYHFSKIEQELHINIVASGFEFPKQEEVLICCSIPRYIIKLSRNPSFLLKKVVISCGLPKGNDVVLQVTGKIYNSKLISIKSQRKITILTPEERVRRIALLKKVRESRITKR